MREPKPVPVKPVREKSRGKELIYSEQARDLEYRTTHDGWTPKRVKCAANSADSGNLLELADLVETMLSDDRIGGVLAQRTHGLLGLPRSFVGGSDLARAALDGPPGPIPGEFDVMCPAEELIPLLTWGIVLGVCPFYLQKLPRVAGQPVRYRLKTWPARALRYSHRAEQGAHWYINTQKGEEPIIPGAGRWGLFTPYGSSRPWINGKWRECAFPWLLKRFALEDRANHSETLGSPTKVGKAPKGSTEPQRRRFRQQLAALAKKGVLVLPEGYSYELVEANGRTWDIYTQGQAWADGAITISLAGQTVTTEGQAGFSEGKIFDSIKGDFIRFDAGRLSFLLRSQVFEPWARDNYSSEADAPYCFWNTEKPVDLEVQSRTWVQFGTAVKSINENLKGTGQRVDVVSACKQYSVPLIAITETTSSDVKLVLAPTDIVKVVTVNEARASQGLPEARENGDLYVSELEKLGTPEKEPLPGEGAQDKKPLDPKPDSAKGEE